MNRISRLRPSCYTVARPARHGRILPQTTLHRISRLAPSRLNPHSSRPLPPESRRFSRRREINAPRQRVIMPPGSGGSIKTVEQLAQQLRTAICLEEGEIELSEFRRFVIKINESNFKEAFDALFSQEDKTEPIETILSSLAALHGRLECKKRYEAFIYWLKRYVDTDYSDKHSAPFLAFAQEAYNHASFSQYGEKCIAHFQTIRTFTLAIDAILQMPHSGFEAYEDLIVRYFVEGFCLTVAVDEAPIPGGPKKRTTACCPDRFWNFNNSIIRYHTEESYRWDVPLSFDFRTLLSDILRKSEADSLLQTILSGFKQSILNFEEDESLTLMRRVRAFGQFCEDLESFKNRFDHKIVDQEINRRLFLEVAAKSPFGEPLCRLLKIFSEVSSPPMPENGDEDSDLLEYIFTHPKVRLNRKWEIYFSGARKYFNDMPLQSIVDLMKEISSIKSQNWKLVIPYIPFSRFSLDPVKAETIDLAVCLIRMDNRNPANHQRLRDFIQAVRLS